MDWLAEHWIWILGGGAFVLGRLLGVGSSNSGEVDGTGIWDWFDGDGDGGGGD